MSRASFPTSVVFAGARARDRRDWGEAVIAELDQAVERQLMGDVPVASLLPGGVDSSLVTRMRAFSPALRTADVRHWEGVRGRQRGSGRRSARRWSWAVPHNSTVLDDHRLRACACGSRTLDRVAAERRSRQ
jgi:hypothetical protein